MLMKLIEDYRRRERMPEKELAERAGITEREYRRYLNAKSVDSNIIESLATALYADFKLERKR